MNEDDDEDDDKDKYEPEDEYEPERFLDMGASKSSLWRRFAVKLGIGEDV